MLEVITTFPFPLKLNSSLWIGGGQTEPNLVTLSVHSVLMNYLCLLLKIKVTKESCRSLGNVCLFKGVCVCFLHLFILLCISALHACM